MRVRVLGPLVVEGVDVVAAGSRKGRTLLAALAAAGGEAVPVDELTELLWGDELPTRPADQISVLASRLRRVLGAHRVERSDAGYALRADWIDVVELAERGAEATARLGAGQHGAARAAASAALELVRGPLAAGELAEWFDARRRTVDRVVMRARSVLAHAALATGDAVTAAAAAADSLDDDPYDEAALRIVMRAQVALGRPASALKAYADMRARLRDDLGVSPVPETQAVHDAIVLGTADRDRVAATGRALVGRDAELRRLHLLLDEVTSGPSAGVEIEGEAGIGKSALAAAFVESAGDRALVIAGRCDEMGRELALQPIVDGVETQLRILPDAVVDVLLAGDAAVAAALLGRSPEGGDRRVPAGDGDAARSVLYRGVLTLVERLAAGRPAIVLVDDAHLAAASTIAWLQMAVRRGRHVLVVTTRRPEAGPALAGATRLDLGPLDVEAVTEWIGAPRASELVDRTGGNPLFLAELIDHDGDDLPASIRELVAARVDALGSSAATLRAAAVLGAAIDLDVLAAVRRQPIAALLDDLERGVAARLLVDDRVGLRFRHELVREALVAGTSTTRRAFLHREAAAALSTRELVDPMAVAWHARHAGDAATTASALTRAAVIAASRFDHAEALRLLDEAVALRDDAVTRLARARVQMTMGDLDAARRDADRAISSGGGGAAFELAGWVAYYRRDHDDTLRLAEEGMVRTEDPDVRASCLTLVGRTRHTLGDLDAAEACLREAVSISTSATRTVAQVWLAALVAHRGADDEALDLTSRARHGLGHVTHPFAPGHAHFARAFALGHRGRAVEALAALDELDAAGAHESSQLRRFGSVADNCRGWVLRNIGELDAAWACNEASATLPADDPPLAEPRFAGQLDLAEHELAIGDVAAAQRRLADTADVEQWTGSMHWRHRARHRLLRARVALSAGEPDTARRLASAVADESHARGVRRYELFATLVNVRAGAPTAPDALTATLAELDRLAGLEVWWLTAELAQQRDDAELWQQARRRVDALAARSGRYAASLQAYAARRFPPLG